MRKFEVVVEELCRHTLIVRAKTEQDVEKIFWENVCSGVYDWSNCEVMYSEITAVEEVKEESEVRI